MQIHKRHIVFILLACLAIAAAISSVSLFFHQETSSGNAEAEASKLVGEIQRIKEACILYYARYKKWPNYISSGMETDFSFENKFSDSDGATVIFATGPKVFYVTYKEEANSSGDMRISVKSANEYDSDSPLRDGAIGALVTIGKNGKVYLAYKNPKKLTTDVKEILKRMSRGLGFFEGSSIDRDYMGGDVIFTPIPFADN